MDYEVKKRLEKYPFNKRIHICRKILNISLVELSKRINRSTLWISSVEYNRVVPSRYELHRIMDILNIREIINTTITPNAKRNVHFITKESLDVHNVARTNSNYISEMDDVELDTLTNRRSDEKESGVG